MTNIIRNGMLLLVLLASSISLRAQSVSESEIPTAVRKTINTLYPTVKEIKWERTKSNSYSAVFLSNGSKTTLVIDPSGNVVTGDNSNSNVATKTSTDVKATSSNTTTSSSNISYQEIPMSVRKQIETKCNPADILSVNKLKDKDGNNVYEFDLASMRIMYNEQGTLLNEFSK